MPFDLIKRILDFDGNLRLSFKLKNDKIEIDKYNSHPSLKINDLRIHALKKSKNKIINFLKRTY